MSKVDVAGCKVNPDPAKSLEHHALHPKFECGNVAIRPTSLFIAPLHSNPVPLHERHIISIDQSRHETVKRLTPAPALETLEDDAGCIS